MGHAFRNYIIKEEYGTKAKYETMSKPQTNSTLAIIRQVIANLVRIFDLQNNYLDEGYSWSGILAATVFAVHSTYHTTLQATPVQLVLVCDTK